MLGQRSLALLDRQPAQVLAVNFERVESAEHGRAVGRPGTEQTKDREPAIIAHNGCAAVSYGA